MGLCHFLTSELFLGRLSLLLGEEDVRFEEFMADDETSPTGMCLSTLSLEQHLHEWRDRVAILSEHKRSALAKYAHQLLQQTAEILSSLSEFLDFTYSNLTEFNDNEPLGMVHFACVLLHQALVQACGRVLGLEVRAGNELSLRSQLPWLKAKMRREGWCPYTLWLLYALNDIEELVYAYALGTVRTQQDHSKCTERVCLANGVNKNQDVSHVRSGCDGCSTVIAPMDEMAEIIRGGGVPVLRIKTDDGYKFSVTASALDEEKNYIALSHVWADGLGSATSNAIAQCQLARIANRLGRIEASQDCGELSVWIDTLCIPVGAEHQALRDSQIQRMNDIYAKARAVLVMDSDLLALKQSASMQIVGAKLSMSAWRSRLWTYQEGSLNANVWLMASDGLISLDDLTTKSRTRNEGDDMLCHNLEDHMIRSTIFGLGRPHYDSHPKDNLTSESRKAFYELLDRLRKDGDNEAQKMLHAIINRTSSRPDDEAVIIGSALGLPVGPILQADPGHRMKVLIESMPCVPANLMFTVGPRLTEPGFTWAPASVLRSKGAYGQNVISDVVPIDSRQARDGSRSARLMNTLAPDGKGLLSFNPAIKIKIVFKISAESTQLTFIMFARAYSFHGLDADFDNNEKNAKRTSEIEQLIRQGKKLAILVPTFDPKSRIYNGALVEVTDGNYGTAISDMINQPGDPSVRPQDQAVKARFIMLVSFAADATARMAQGMSAHQQAAVDARGEMNEKANDEEVMDRMVFIRDETETSSARDGDKAEAEEQSDADGQREGEGHDLWLWPRFWLVC